MMADHRPFDGYVRPRWLDTPDWTYIIPTDHPTIKKREPFGSLAASKEYHDQKMQVEPMVDPFSGEQTGIVTKRLITKEEYGSMQMNKRSGDLYALRGREETLSPCYFMENEKDKEKKNNDWTEVSDRVFCTEKRVDSSKDRAWMEGNTWGNSEIAHKNMMNLCELWEKYYNQPGRVFKIPMNVSLPLTTKNKGIKNMFKRKADKPVEMNKVATRDQVKAWVLSSYGESRPMEIKVDHFNELVVREPHGSEFKEAKAALKRMGDNAVQAQITATTHTAAMIKLQERIDSLEGNILDLKAIKTRLISERGEFEVKFENATEEAKRWKKLNLESTIERDMTKDLLEKEVNQRISLQQIDKPNKSK